MAEKIKVSLEQLIKKKLEKDSRRTATKEIYIESLGGYITFNAPTDAQHIEYTDKISDGSYSAMIPAMERLIYDCCPLLHSKELQEKTGVEYPYDIVRAIFGLEEILDIGVALVNFFKENEENSNDNKENKDGEDKLKN